MWFLGAMVLWTVLACVIGPLVGAVLARAGDTALVTEAPGDPSALCLVE